MGEETAREVARIGETVVVGSRSNERESIGASRATIPCAPPRMFGSKCMVHGDSEGAATWVIPAAMRITAGSAAGRSGQVRPPPALDQNVPLTMRCPRAPSIP